MVEYGTRIAIQIPIIKRAVVKRVKINGKRSTREGIQRQFERYFV